MINGLFQNSAIGVLEQVAAFSQARHGVLAGNIANLDTPGYKTRDLSVNDFQTKLKEAIQAARQPQTHQSPGIIDDVASDPADPMSEVKQSMRNILFHDDSDVGLEQQVLEVANNQFMHNVSVALMSQQFRQLQTAISERV